MNNKKILLLALPFAGGNSYSYNFLKALLPGNIHLETLEYPGRGKRSKTALVNQMDVLIDDLLPQYHEIVKEVNPGKVVVYGHSIGSVIGLTLIHVLNREKDLLKPEMAIFSGHGGPQLTPKRMLSSLPSRELIAYFESIGSLQKEIVNDAELIDYILPILRNDLVLYENYTPVYENKLTIPLAVINGKQDNILQKDIDGWQFETTVQVEFYQMEGHHFFMSQFSAAFSGLIINLLTDSTAKAFSGIYERQA
ncbi:MAG: Surfactin synthase thioesterase subunit [Mucilaginibacter sp.]|nr:Surfactin synthase thioesterase subunit [Mucilaginibacter sp.]